MHGAPTSAMCPCGSMRPGRPSSRRETRPLERPVVVAVHGGPGLDHMTVKSARGCWPRTSRWCTSTCGATAAAITAVPSSGTCGAGPMTCGGCATRSGCASRSCSAAASAGTSRSPTRRCSPITLAASSWPTRLVATGTTRESSRRSAASAGTRRPPSSSASAHTAGAVTPRTPRISRLSSPASATRYSATPGWAEESRRFLARMIRNPDVASHYDSHEVSSFDPWSLIGAVRCRSWSSPARTTRFCPLPVVEELASQLPRKTTRVVTLPGARHTIFRDRPDLAFPAVRDFVFQINASQPAS